MKNKLLKLSMWQGIIAAVVFVINYFFYHFVTDNGITLTWQLSEINDNALFNL